MRLNIFLISWGSNQLKRSKAGLCVRASNESNRCSQIFKRLERERYYYTLLLIIVSIISALSIVPMCAAQSGYEIRNAAVTPEYGYEDFTYTAQVWMSEDV